MAPYIYSFAITDGLFLRRLQSDPDLPGVGTVIFDEFHERRRNSDVALALLREARRLLRPDLKLLLMSATLQLETLAAQFEGAETLPGPLQRIRRWDAPLHICMLFLTRLMMFQK